MAKAWQNNVVGTKMFYDVHRLKCVKKELKELNKQGFSDVQTVDAKASHDMHVAQELMHTNVGNQEIADVELEQSVYIKKSRKYTLSS